MKKTQHNQTICPLFGFFSETMNEKTGSKNYSIDISYVEK